MKSIKLKFFSAIFAIALAFITIISALNLFFYDDYYLYSRKSMLNHFMGEINPQYSDSLSPILGEINQMELETGLRMSILSPDGTLIYDTVLYNPDPKDPAHGDDSYYLSNLRISLLALQKVDQDALQAGEYTYVTVQEKASASDYLCLVCKLGEDFAIARIPYAYMEQNTSFNAFFLLVSGGVTLILCLGLAYGISKRFTAPLIRMNHLANNMANLDFSTQYTGKTQDEIGQLGQALNTMSAHLEQTIAQLQQSNAKLSNQVAQKEQIDAMRREFIINVSHELKTPIALVQGYAEGLQAGIADNPEDRAYYCQTIAEEAMHMNHMVSQLLALSKLEDGHIRPQYTEIDITALCQQTVAKTTLLWKEKGLHIACTQDAVWAQTDGMLMTQIVENYLTNAIRYTPEQGKIEIVVDEQQEGVTIAVRNQGEQVLPMEIPKLWDKFYRTDKARSREMGGTGIGLSIVKATAEAMGLQYGARNVADGMEFWVKLPEARK